MLAAWVRNLVALVTMTGWIAFVAASIKRGTVPDWYFWGIPVAILTGLPKVPPGRTASPPRQQEDNV